MFVEGVVLIFELFNFVLKLFDFFVVGLLEQLKLLGHAGPGEVDFFQFLSVDSFGVFEFLEL